jgi:hypothetical protein
MGVIRFQQFSGLPGRSVSRLFKNNQRSKPLAKRQLFLSCSLQQQEIHRFFLGGSFANQSAMEDPRLGIQELSSRFSRKRFRVEVLSRSLRPLGTHARRTSPHSNCARRRRPCLVVQKIRDRSPLLQLRRPGRACRAGKRRAMNAIQTIVRSTDIPRPRLRAGKDRHEGVVASVNDLKRFATLTTQFGYIFCPFNSIRSVAADGSRTLKRGDHVSFYLAEPTPSKGPLAMHVRIISPK